MEKTMVTRAEVAALAGVSPMTVTRVLNNSSAVTPETRQAVLAACTKLNYRRNAFASGLRSRQSHAIGVMVPTFRHAFYGRLLSSLEKTAREYGYHIITVQIDSEQEGADMQWERLEFLFSRQVDGLILELSLAPEVEEKLLAENIPVVFVDAPPLHKEFDYFGSSDEYGTWELTRMLLKLGHRRIAFAGGGSCRTSEARCHGWQRALKEAGLDCEAGAAFPRNFDFEDGVEIVGAYFEQLRQFSAIVCANDYVAAGMIAAFQERGVRIPDELSITGFAGDEIGRFIHPSLTTYEQPIEKIGELAALHLIQKIQQPGAPLPVRWEQIRGKVIVRRSVMEIR